MLTWIAMGRTMRADELRDAGALAGTTLGDVTDTMRATHHAIAARLFGLAGAPAEPIKLMHDGIAAIAYGSTRFGVRRLPQAAGLIASVFQADVAESAHDSRRGRFVLGAVNGFLGDQIAI